MSEPIHLQSLGPTPLSTPHLTLSSSREPDAPVFPDSEDITTVSRQSHDSTRRDVESPTVISQEGPVDYIPALPPVDGGRQAWSFLAAATIMEMLIWGIPFAVGTLHEYWLSTLFKGKGEGTITLAATLQTGLLYGSTAAFGPLLAAYPRYMRHLQIICLLIAGGSLIASAFVTRPWHLILTIGIFYPFAGASYVPAATLLFEWFHARRGLATGVLYGGTGLGGAVASLVISGMLSKFGYKGTMISLGLALIIIGHICLIFIKRRIPIPKHDHSTSRARRAGGQKVDWSFLRRPVLLSGVLTILITSLGSFVPVVWLPTYAKDAGLMNGSTLVAILNGISGPGYMIVGYLSDRYPLIYVLLTCCVGSALSCFFLWGFGTTNAVMIVFVLFFGLLAPSITALWSGMISIIARDDPMLPQFIFCIFSFTRGVGNITSGPISDSLLQYDVLRGKAGAYGVHNYGILLIYTGATIFAGCFTSVCFYRK